MSYQAVRTALAGIFWGSATIASAAALFLAPFGRLVSRESATFHLSKSCCAAYELTGFSTPQSRDCMAVRERETQAAENRSLEAQCTPVGSAPHKPESIPFLKLQG